MIHFSSTSLFLQRKLRAKFKKIPQIWIFHIHGGRKGWFWGSTSRPVRIFGHCSVIWGACIGQVRCGHYSRLPLVFTQLLCSFLYYSFSVRVYKFGYQKQILKWVGLEFFCNREKANPILFLKPNFLFKLAPTLSFD